MRQNVNDVMSEWNTSKISGVHSHLINTTFTSELSWERTYFVRRQNFNMNEYLSFIDDRGHINRVK